MTKESMIIMLNNLIYRNTFKILQKSHYEDVYQMFTLSCSIAHNKKTKCYTICAMLKHKIHLIFK